MTDNSPTRPGIDAFHKERSKCVDAFADLELAVRKILEREGVKTGLEPFGQKLGKLAKLIPSPRLSKSKVAALQILTERCQRFSDARNDIVHSRLQIAVIDDVHKACFINPAKLSDCGEGAKLFTLQAIRYLSSEISGLADDLTSFSA